MNKKKIKVVMTIVPLVLAVSFLSGCIAQNAIQTKGWDHINTEGTAVRLWGFLILGENFHNWDGWFVYDTVKHDNWELYEYRVEADNYGALNTFSVDIDNLTRTTEYHYRAVGEHKSQGATIRVGIDKTFIPGGPRVIVKQVSDIGLTSAVINGELTHMGGVAECEVFFRYGTDPDNLDMETPKETMTSTGDFSYEVTGLISCESYHYRAVAINDADTWDSFYMVTFTPGLPIVETYLPTNVSTNSATYNGELFTLGGTASCDVWFEYGDENPNQLDETTDSITMTIPGEFSIEVTGLSTATTYWVQSVSDNGVCQFKGKVKEFRTAGPLGSEPQLQERDFDIKTRLHNLIKTRYNWIEDYIDDYPMLKKILG
jgi:hypothetical protein